MPHDPPMVPSPPKLPELTPKTIPSLNPHLCAVEMNVKEPSQTLPPSSSQLDPKLPLEDLEVPRQEFPCLPSNPTPNQTPLIPNLNSSQAAPASDSSTPSLNPWTKPPSLGLLKTRKFSLRFILPTPRGNDLVGICPSAAVAGELQILDLTLVGFFLGRKPGFSFVRSNLLKQWKLRGSVQVLQLIQGGLAFRFSDIEDRDQILEAGVFYVSGQPIFFRSWERNIHSGGILGLKQIPLWVSLPGLPLHLWGEESLSAICSVLGKPLYSDRITAEKSRWSFARVCVEFSGAAPLLDSIIIEDDVGNVFLQPVKYDWKPPHCTSCGIFGHIQDSCKQGHSEAEQEEEEEMADKIQNLNLPKETIPIQTSEDVNSESAKGIGNNPNQDLVHLRKGKTFSELLQKHTSKLLRSWNPIRVKKTGPAMLDPTRNRNQLQIRLQNSDLNLNPEHVWTSGASSSGPYPCSMDKGDQTTPISVPPYLEKNSKFKMPAPFDPPLTNRFGILDLELDQSACTQPDEESLSDSDSDLSLGHEPGPNFCSTTHPCDESNRDLNCTNQTGILLNSEVLVPNHVDRSPFTPISSHNIPIPLTGSITHTSELVTSNFDPKPSSIGRTPYPSKSSMLSRTVQSSTLKSLSTSRTIFKPHPSNTEKLIDQPILNQPIMDTRMKDGIIDDRFLRTSDSSDPRRILFC